MIKIKIIKINIKIKIIKININILYNLIFSKHESSSYALVM